MKKDWGEGKKLQMYFSKKEGNPTKKRKKNFEPR